MSPVQINPESRCRIPLPRRGDLDSAGQKIFDYFTSGSKGVLRGLHGPAGIWLHEPKLAEVYVPFGNYLRFAAGISEPVREASILAMARECNSAFEWAAHEPEALKEGVEPRVIDVIKHRQSTSGLDETDATVIELGRQIFRDHKVTPETFAKAKALFGPNKLIELVMLMGNYAGTAALLTAVDMQLHPGQKPLLPIP